MGPQLGATNRWRRWALAWSPAVVIGAAWTIVRVDTSGVVASALFCVLCSLIGIEVARDHGSLVAPVVTPVVAVWVPSLLGPLRDAPEATLVGIGLMVLTSPTARSRLWRDRGPTRVPARQLSDWDLETQWSDSEAELRSSSAHPEQKLAVVQRRAELLDELVRRREHPAA